MPIPFAKYEGLGNDFLVVDVAAAPGLGPDEAIALCDRHRGVGGDGVLLVGERGGLPSMDVINADGSRPEMCGNGLRCVARYLANAGRASGERFEVATAAGPHMVTLHDDGTVTVAMRPASFAPADVGVEAGAPVIDEPIELEGAQLRVTAVSMGNPHAVTFDQVGDGRLLLAPVLGAHPRFAAGANVGFARMASPARLELHVFERGAGWTQACGTGACAAAAAAVETGRAVRGTPLDVALPGGVLAIVVGAPDEPIFMTGPARHVFDGVARDPRVL